MFYLKDILTFDQGRLWNGFRNGCLAVANCRGRFFSVIIDHIRNSRLWDEFTNLCSKIANYRGSFFLGLKDGLWPGFRNGCISSANCRGRFFPVIKECLQSTINDDDDMELSMKSEKSALTQNVFDYNLFIPFKENASSDSCRLIQAYKRSKISGSQNSQMLFLCGVLSEEIFSALTDIKLIIRVSIKFNGYSTIAQNTTIQSPN
ncbi:unnamed protein product [Mytilus coruscus]|uniref:Uncharacterized protein n=1 Tax=Mytilus coruscus TaxID=42192 RepID=A0A6J8DLP4_MYTCO|nr:unnamed protein product [Mytilus coruscus]